MTAKLDRLKDFALTYWKFALILIAAVSLSFLLGQCDGARKERHRIEAAQAKAAQEATHRADADEQARRDAADNRADAIEGAMNNASDGNRTGAVIDELRRRRGQ